MKLTKEEVQHVAMLARLELSEKQVEKFQTELSNILNYVELLKEVPTDSVQPTRQTNDLKSVMRSDEVRAEPLAAPESLLNCSPLYNESQGQIRVPNVF